MAEPEWDVDSRAWALALAGVEDALCPCGCGLPVKTAQAPEADGKFTVPPPVRCHARTALVLARIKYEDAPQPEALLFHVEEAPGG